MTRRASVRRILQTLGVALLCMALAVGRAVTPAPTMPILAQALLADAGICHAESSPTPGDQTPGQAQDCHDHACCQAAAHPAVLAPPAPAIAARAWTPARHLLLPAPTGPPRIAVSGFRSRAPPVRSA